MNISRLLNLVITISDRATSGVDLGIPLLMAYHTHGNARVREFSDPAEMLDVGFTTDDYVYKQAVSLKSQENAPPTFKVGRRGTALTQTFRFIPTSTTPGDVYLGTWGGAAWTYTVQSGDDLGDVCTGVAAAIDGLSTAAATATATEVNITSPAGVWHDVDPGPFINVLDLTPDTTTDDDIAACLAEDDEWYGYLQEASSPASIALVAAAIEPLRKIAIVQSPDWNILDGATTNDIASVLHDANYTRTFGIWHPKSGGTEWLATAWMAGRLTAQPGSETWAFKTLAGPTVDKISTSAESALISKNWNSYTRFGSKKTGRAMTFDGKAGGGRYGDVVRVVDALFFDIQQTVIAALGDNKKIPFDNSGIAVAKACVEAPLFRMERAGGLLKGSSKVDGPVLADIPASVRATRIIPDIEFETQLGGAVHGMKVTGVVTS